MRLKNYILFVFLFFAAVQNYAQVNAVVRLDSNVILIGDQINLHFEFSCPKNTNVRFPLINDTIIKEIEVLKRTEIDTLEEGDLTTLSQSLTITCFDSGYYVIPPYDFYYHKKNDTNIFTAQTSPLLLTVNTIPVDTTKAIKPIKGPMSAPVTFKEVVKYILIGIAAILLILGIIYYFKKRKKSEPLIKLPKKPKIPAHVVALKELEKLRIKKLWQSGKIKEYHSRLTDIIRTYIEERFKIPALEMTSSEILPAFDMLEKNQDVKNKLSQILLQADLVKFAKAQPLPDENDISYKNALGFVQETTPTEKSEINEPKIEK